jgi:pyruvate,water dikinase
VVTTDTYNSFLEDNRLKDKISALLQRLDIKNTGNLETLSGEIKLLFEAAWLSPRLEAHIDRLLTQFAADRFAVRSSALNEDLPGVSFAGQMDSYLDVPGSEVKTKVKSVFASLFNSRAIYYREMKGFSHDAGTAVIIQEMIPAEFAGVLFTRDPINKTHIIIEIAAGLGEKVVSGTASPNSYMVNRDNLHIEKLDEPTPFNRQMVKQIARIGLEIERQFIRPQDMEFAVINETVFILQARPITVEI